MRCIFQSFPAFKIHCAFDEVIGCNQIRVVSRINFDVWRLEPTVSAEFQQLQVFGVSPSVIRLSSTTSCTVANRHARVNCLVRTSSICGRQNDDHVLPCVVKSLLLTSPRLGSGYSRQFCSSIASQTMQRQQQETGCKRFHAHDALPANHHISTLFPLEQ
jgi:hypothetical protein